MNTGIELLVKRIKDCPDEFDGGDWNRLIDLYSNYKNYFSDEEQSAVNNALREAKREIFTGKVMEIIANNEVIGKFVEPYQTKTAGFGAAPIKAEGAKIAISPSMATAISNSLSVGRETLTEQNLIDIKKQLANLK